VAIHVDEGPYRIFRVQLGEVVQGFRVGVVPAKLRGLQARRQKYPRPPDLGRQGGVCLQGLAAVAAVDQGVEFLQHGSRLATPAVHARLHPTDRFAHGVGKQVNHAHGVARPLQQIEFLVVDPRCVRVGPEQRGRVPLALAQSQEAEDCAGLPRVQNHRHCQPLWNSLAHV